MSKALPRINVVAPLRFFTVAQRVVGKHPNVIHVTTLASTRSFCGLVTPSRGGVSDEPSRGEKCATCFVKSASRQHAENEKALRLW